MDDLITTTDKDPITNNDLPNVSKCFDSFIDVSKAKFCEESHGRVRFCPAPQKPIENLETRNF